MRNIHDVMSLLRKEVFEESLVSVIVSKLLSIDAFGRLALKTSIFLKKLFLSRDFFSQRAAEYPWVLNQLKLVKSGSLLLDVGCAESLLSHELNFKGFRVVGLDIRDCPFKNKKMMFVKRNLINTGLRSDLFDAAVMISTVEHIGLHVYGQLTLEDEGDLKAMNELHRILKLDGILIMSTPYIAQGQFKVYSYERNYNRERLNQLVQNFDIVKEDYFAPVRHKSKIFWKKFTREEIDKQSLAEPGIACLVLRKILVSKPNRQ